MAVTIDELNTLYVEVLSNVTNAQNADFTSAAPADLTAQVVDDKSTAKSVTAGSISAVSITPFTAVDFQSVSTTDEVTNESLNRTAKTLRDDVNTKMGDFTSSITLAVNGLKGDIASSINTLTTDVNQKLADITSEQTSQVSDINTKIGNLTTDLNTQLAAIRTAESQQSGDIAQKLNQLAGELTANIVKVKNIADNAQQKIASLSDVYNADGDIANKIATINGFISTLRESDIDFIGAIDGTIDEVNSLRRVFTKEILVTAGNGVYSFTNLAEGAGEFANVSDYVVSVNAINNFKVRASLENKTKDGFDVRVISHGVHFVPQPVDCSVTPTKVSVEITFDKKNPLTFNVDTLNSSFVTNGNGTDVNVTGAMQLSSSNVNVAVGADTAISALGGTTPISATSLDTDVATVAVSGSVVTVTGVAAGSTTVTVSDAAGTTRTATVTVA